MFYFFFYFYELVHVLNTCDEAFLIFFLFNFLDSLFFLIFIKSFFFIKLYIHLLPLWVALCRASYSVVTNFSNSSMYIIIYYSNKANIICDNFLTSAMSILNSLYATFTLGMNLCQHGMSIPSPHVHLCMLAINHHMLLHIYRL